MKISVIIPAYNEEKTIRHCLDSVIQALPNNKEIIVVDNDSYDKTREIVKGFTKVKLLVEKKRGAAASRNRGLKEAAGDLIIFVDADVIVKQNTFIELLKCMHNDAVAGAGGMVESCNKVNLISLSQEPRFLGNSLLDTRIREVDNIPTAIVAYKAEILKNVDYFNEDYYLCGEDMDLSYRIRKQGYKLIVNPSSVGYHHHVFSTADLIRKWFNYGIGWAKLSKEHKKYFDLSLNISWLMAVTLLLFLSFLRKEFIVIFFIVLILPWVIYFSIPSLRYLAIKKDARALIFPVIHHLQILARSAGILYGTFRGR
jgi:GT2 family glycosyltransferase